MDFRKLSKVLGAIALCLALLSSHMAAHAMPMAQQPVQDDASAPVEPAAVDAASELLVFDWNRPITVQAHGFPWDNPPRAAANGNWKTPVNFAEGTFYFRVQIRSQPKAQNNRLQFCLWQTTLKRESCGKLKTVTGKPGTVVTWSQSISSMWKKNGKPIDWTKPRSRNGFAIKNEAGKPVSDFSGWNWNGENPAKWYPLDARLTVVVVAKGKTFSGWKNYVGANAVETPASAEDDASNADVGSGLPEDAVSEDVDTGALQSRRLFLPVVSN